MRLSRLRFTVRRMIITVAAAATVFWAYRGLPFVIGLLNDDPYLAFGTTSCEWDARPSHSVTVDIFEGSIQVLPSGDDKVRVAIHSSSLTKISQAAADEALAAIELGLDRRGDVIRITARGASGRGISKATDVQLLVPQGVSLDLRTGRGCIYVGRRYNNGVLVHAPIAVSSIRARNDSPYMSGYAQGHIGIETKSPHTFGMPPTATRLQLSASGRIEVVADLATIEAHAWHGAPPQSWTPGIYEGKGEGEISFAGTLAVGDNTLRAAHLIDVKLPESNSVRVDAEAVGGGLTGDLLPSAIEQSKGLASWCGSIGSGPSARLRLRTDDGPIRLGRSP